MIDELLSAENALGLTNRPSKTDRAAAAERTVTVGGTVVRPASIPLAVRSPYLSTWLPATWLVGTTPQFWDGSPRGFSGLIRIDGELYTWAGRPEVGGVAPPAMTQTSVNVTATRSIFTLRGAGVELVVEFLSPVEPGDLRRQSVPLSLLTASVRAIDRHRHKIELYAEITGEWASSDEGSMIEWQVSTSTAGRYWTIHLQDQRPLTESSQMAQWGSALWGTVSGRSTSYQSGNTAIRGRFAGTGELANVSDPKFRAVDDDQPLFAFAHDFGVTNGGLATFVLGHARTPLVSYGSAGTPLVPLWTRHWGGWRALADDFLRDAPGARHRAVALDAKVERAAKAAAGPGYSALCSLALRQCYGGTELVIGPRGEPWLMGKEISSGGNTNTVDIFDQAYLAWLWLDPDLVPLVMAPILDWCASPEYQDPAAWQDVPFTADGKKFCVHDLGVYPIAAGLSPLNQEWMPIEESAGMLIMAASYARRAGAEKARPFLAQWRLLWTQWAEYLKTQVPTPQIQLTTNDWLDLPFLLPTGDVNLGVKALIGLVAAAQIATILRDSALASRWSAAAKDNVGQWVGRSTDISGTHLNLEQGRYGTWSSLYNAYYEKVIGVQLVPEHVAAMQARRYLTKLTAYGMPMQTEAHNVNKVAWLIFLAAWLEKYPIREELMRRNVKFVNDTPTRVPYCDRYDTTTGVGAAGIEAHPTLGAVFAFLAAGGSGASWGTGGMLY